MKLRAKLKLTMMTYHFNKGGNFYGWQKKYNGSCVEIKNNMDTPVDEKILSELLQYEEFRKAYLPDGLTPDQFRHYGAFLDTMNQFLTGYDNLVQLIRKYIQI